MLYSALGLGDFGRKAIIVLGNHPLDTRPFIERNLGIVYATSETAHKHYPFSKAIIISEKVENSNAAAVALQSVRTGAENNGLALKVLVHNDEYFRQVSTASGITQSSFYNEANRIPELAETLARFSPGPPDGPQKVSIECKGLRLKDEIQLLLRRSFSDCTKIFVESMSGGKASIGLYKVYAWIGHSEVGPQPLPFFAKIADHEHITTELTKYREYTDLYISFQYRPNCRIERCVKTQNYASLVGNFVDEAISLRTALQETHHSGIIFSLFEKSLKGFRRQPFISRRSYSTELKGFIEKKISLVRLQRRSDVIDAARKMGFRADVQALYNRLLDKCPPHCLTGPFHGDLNARNVMIKGSDAIVIDFYSVEAKGPLTADPVNLEVSLCFEVGERRPPSFKKWKSLIDEAYDPQQLLKPLPISEQIPGPLSWLRKSIREIRHILLGCDCCHPEEIKAVVSAYLLRTARQAPEEIKGSLNKMEFKYRAYALVVAEKIINSLK